MLWWPHVPSHVPVCHLRYISHIMCPITLIYSWYSLPKCLFLAAMQSVTEVVIQLTQLLWKVQLKLSGPLSGIIWHWQTFQNWSELLNLFAVPKSPHFCCVYYKWSPDVSFGFLSAIALPFCLPVVFIISLSSYLSRCLDICLKTETF